MKLYYACMSQWSLLVVYSLSPFGYQCVTFCGTVSFLRMRVVGVTAMVVVCARDRRGDDHGRGHWFRGGHPGYHLGFDGEIINSRVARLSKTFPYWLPMALLEISRLSLMGMWRFLEWVKNSLYQQRVILFCVIYFSISKDIYIDFVIDSSFCIVILCDCIMICLSVWTQLVDKLLQLLWTAFEKYQYNSKMTRRAIV